MSDVVNVDKEPELGDNCPNDCVGTLVEYRTPELLDRGCSCHIAPPCSYCTDTTLICNLCGWEPEENGLSSS